MTPQIITTKTPHIRLKRNQRYGPYALVAIALLTVDDVVFMLEP